MYEFMNHLWNLGFDGTHLNINPICYIHRNGVKKNVLRNHTTCRGQGVKAVKRWVVQIVINKTERKKSCRAKKKKKNHESIWNLGYNMMFLPLRQKCFSECIKWDIKKREFRSFYQKRWIIELTSLWPIHHEGKLKVGAWNRMFHIQQVHHPDK